MHYVVIVPFVFVLLMWIAGAILVGTLLESIWRFIALFGLFVGCGWILLKLFASRAGELSFQGFFEKRARIQGAAVIAVVLAVIGLLFPLVYLLMLFIGGIWLCLHLLLYVTDELSFRDFFGERMRFVKWILAVGTVLLGLWCAFLLFPFSVKTICPACFGKGTQVCWTCDGDGKVQSGFLKKIPCERCGGTGKKTCGSCKGDGNVTPYIEKKW